MPKAAFKDLWDTVHTGREWRGLVKNLRKDGGFYWVDALITPSYNGNELVVTCRYVASLSGKRSKTLFLFTSAC